MNQYGTQSDSVSFSSGENVTNPNNNQPAKKGKGGKLLLGLGLLGAGIAALTHGKSAPLKELLTKKGLKNLFTKKFASEMWQTIKSPVKSFKQAKIFQKVLNGEMKAKNAMPKGEAVGESINKFIGVEPKIKSAKDSAKVWEEYLSKK